MPLTIGGADYSSVGPILSYLSQQDRQQQDDLERRLRLQAETRARATQAQQSMEQQRNADADRQRAYQEAQSRFMAGQQQAQQFHQDQINQENARLAQAEALRKDAAAQQAQQFQVAEQRRRDALDQEAQLKQEAAAATAQKIQESAAQRAREITAKNLGQDAEEARKYARTPEDTRTADWLRNRAADVEQGFTSPSNAYNTGRLDAGTQGPQPEPMTSLEQIRTNATKQRDQERQDAADLRAQQYKDVTENRTERTKQATARAVDLKTKQQGDAYQSVMNRAKDLPYNVWAKKAAAADVPEEELAAHPLMSTLSSIRSQSEQYPDQREFIQKTLAGLQGTLPDAKNSVYRAELKALEPAVIPDKTTAPELWLREQRDNYKHLHGQDKSALANTLQGVLKDSKWPDQPGAAPPANRPSGAPPAMPEPVPAAPPQARPVDQATKQKRYEWYLSAGYTSQQATSAVDADIAKGVIK